MQTAVPPIGTRADANFANELTGTVQARQAVNIGNHASSSRDAKVSRHSHDSSGADPSNNDLSKGDSSGPTFSHVMAGLVQLPQSNDLPKPKASFSLSLFGIPAPDAEVSQETSTEATGDQAGPVRERSKPQLTSTRGKLEKAVAQNGIASAAGANSNPPIEEPAQTISVFEGSTQKKAQPDSTTPHIVTTAAMTANITAATKYFSASPVAQNTEPFRDDQSSSGAAEEFRTSDRKTHTDPQPKEISGSKVTRKTAAGENAAQANAAASTEAGSVRALDVQALGLTPLAVPETLTPDAPSQKPQSGSGKESLPTNDVFSPAGHIPTTNPLTSGWVAGEPALALRLREKRSDASSDPIDNDSSAPARPETNPKVTETLISGPTEQQPVIPDRSIPVKTISVAGEAQTPANDSASGLQKNANPVSAKEQRVTPAAAKGNSALNLSSGVAPTDRKLQAEAVDSVKPVEASLDSQNRTPLSPVESSSQYPPSPAGPKHETAPLANPVVIPDRAEQKSPLRNFSLEFTPDGAKDVRLHVSQHSGDVHVSLHSTDSGLTSRLRDGVQDLIGNLDQAGYEANAWNPQDSGGRQREQDDREPDQPAKRPADQSDNFENLLQFPTNIQEIK